MNAPLDKAPAARRVLVTGAQGFLGRGLVEALARAPHIEHVVAVDVRDVPPQSRLPRVTCVVDGDTFWYAGTKIRLADINTPEVSRPACPAEARLGRRASERLQQMLNAGPLPKRQRASTAPSPSTCAPRLRACSSPGSRRL